SSPALVHGLEGVGRRVEPRRRRRLRQAVDGQRVLREGRYGPGERRCPGTRLSSILDPMRELPCCCGDGSQRKTTGLTSPYRELAAWNVAMAPLGGWGVFEGCRSRGRERSGR